MNNLRKNIPKADQIAIYKRDAWTCRYCDKPVFFGPSISLLNNINPGHGYYHKNGKSGAMVEIFYRQWASVDHYIPVVDGGQNNIDNYYTACWYCNNTINSASSDHKQVLPINQTNLSMGWDGLSGLYLKLGPKDTWHRLISLCQQGN